MRFVWLLFHALFFALSIGNSCVFAQIHDCGNLDFENCDLVIEAVYENEMIKAKALKDAEQHIDEYAIFATNTLSIPITKLAEAAYRPENYVGLGMIFFTNC